MSNTKPFSPDNRAFSPKEALLQQSIRANALSHMEMGAKSARRSVDFHEEPKGLGQAYSVSKMQPIEESKY